MEEGQGNRPGGLQRKAGALVAGVVDWVCSVPGTIFESDRDAERAGVYRRSHAAKFYDSDAERLVQRAVAPEFATTGALGPPAASAERPDFTVKVVNGVPQVVARGPADADAAALEAAAMRSDSLLVKPIKAQLQGGEAGAGEIQPQVIGNAEQTGRRKQAGGK